MLQPAYVALLLLAMPGVLMPMLLLASLLRETEAVGEPGDSHAADAAARRLTAVPAWPRSWSDRRRQPVRRHLPLPLLPAMMRPVGPAAGALKLLTQRRGAAGTSLDVLHPPLPLRAYSADSAHVGRSQLELQGAFAASRHSTLCCGTAWVTAEHSPAVVAAPRLLSIRAGCARARHISCTLRLAPRIAAARPSSSERCLGSLP